MSTLDTQRNEVVPPHAQGKNGSKKPVEASSKKKATTKAATKRQPQIQTPQVVKGISNASEDVKAFLAKELAALQRQLTELRVVREPKPEPVPLVLSSINKIMEELAPLAKTHLHPDEGFDFRKIDEICAELQPLLIRHKVIAVPEVLEATRRENPVVDNTGYRYVEFFTTVKTRWYLVSTIDGSTFPVPCVTMGEGMSDMHFSTNSAQTMAFKQMLVEVFCIPVYGAVDPEEVTGARVGDSRPAYTIPEATIGRQPATTNTEPSLFDLAPPDTDMPVANEPVEEKGKRTRKSREPQTAVAGVQGQALDTQAPAQSDPINKGFIGILKAKMADRCTEEELFAHFGVDGWGGIRLDHMGEANVFIEKQHARA